MSSYIPPIHLEIEEKIAGNKKNLRSVRISSKSVKIGTSTLNDIDLTLSSKNFSVEIRFEEGQWWLNNSSQSSLVRQNGLLISHQHPLQSGDEILLDQHRLRFSYEAAPRAKPKFPFRPQPAGDEALWNYLVEEDQFDEVMINGSGRIYVDYQGSLHASPWRFSSDDFVAQLIQAGSQKSSGWASWRLKKHLRIHAALPPLVESPHICIRKGRPHVFSLNELLARKFGSEEQIQFLKDVIERRESILISGPTSTGKTVLMRSLVESVPSEERLVILEEEAETTWPHPHAILVETGRGGLKEGIRESLRFRPNRLIVSEIRGDEAQDFLQCINTGHSGCITTIHANSPRDAITRVETLVLGSGWSVDPAYIRSQIASALDILVQLSRDSSGHRKIESIQRITGIQQGVILLSDPIGIETTGIVQSKKQK
jgi:Flp pilus assembly CpaF family ATPase